MSFASYVVFGGFYPSLVKQYEVSTPLSIISLAKASLDLPVIVIGGMTVDNCGVLIDQGADMVAAICGLYAQTDSKQAAQNIHALFKN